MQNVSKKMCNYPQHCTHKPLRHNANNVSASTVSILHIKKQCDFFQVHFLDFVTNTVATVKRFYSDNMTHVSMVTTSYTM